MAIKNRKTFLPALFSIALVFSLILPASAVGASATVPLLDDHFISRSTADGSRLASTIALNTPQGQATPMVVVGTEAENDKWDLSDAALQYQLSIASTAGGTVTTPDVGNFTYDAGTVVNLMVTPNAGYRFVNWTGDTGTLSCQCHSTTITMNGDYAITANFERIPPPPINWPLIDGVIAAAVVVGLVIFFVRRKRAT